MIFVFLIGAAGVFLVIAASAEKHYRDLSSLSALPSDSTTLPHDQGSPASVDVIVPARDEAHQIERVARSLASLRYPALRVTVIDDHSKDATAALARAAGVEVVRLESEPPMGWTGKCHACEQGARRSTSDWLLFTDADTFHTPDSLAVAVAYAERHGLDALSLLLRQECVGFWDRLILPLAYQNFFAVLRPSAPAFNGQYILIRRAVYERSGGFGAVRGRVMEDVALAERLAADGYRIALVNGERLASVRMYENGAALWRGMTKTVFTAAHDQGMGGFVLAALSLIGTGVLATFIVGGLSGNLEVVRGAALVSSLNAILIRPWLARFGVRPAIGFALLNPIGGAVLCLIGLVGTARGLMGHGVRWKGRLIREAH